MVRQRRPQRRPERTSADAGDLAGAADIAVVGVVDSIVPGGDALVRDANLGVIFVRGAFPGERVELSVQPKKKGVHRASLLRILDASPERVAVDCALHDRCGGCDLLALSPSAALEARDHIVRDALVRVGRIGRDVVDKAVRPIRAPNAAEIAGGLASRRRARFVVVGGRPTYSAASSHARVPIEHCPALHPTLDEALAKIAAVKLPDHAVLRVAVDDRGHVSAAIENASPADVTRLVASGAAHGALLLALDHDDNELARAGDVVLLGEVAPGSAQPCASDAGVFTQATRFGGRAILDEVLAAANVTTEARVLELFAGSGHLTVPLLERGARVVAVEGAVRGLRYLDENTARFGDAVRTKRAFIDGSLDVTHLFDDARIDVLVADPPRTGIPGFAQLLENAKAERVVLVSCDVATGARDIALALRAGYVLESVVPIDAFPRTSHVEWVAALSRSPKT